MRIYQAGTGAGRTMRLREVWAKADGEQVLVWVENAQQVASWLTWQAESYPGRTLHLGTFRAWARRWLQEFWPWLAPHRVGLPEAQPQLPSVLGAQWWLGQVLDRDLVQEFLDRGWSHERLVAQLTRWSVQQAEGLPLGLTEELAPLVQACLTRYREQSWARGIFDTGQQVQVVRDYLLTDPVWVAQLAARYPHWLCDDVEEWPPAFWAILTTFRAQVRLDVAFNPYEIHQQPRQAHHRELLDTPPVWSVAPSSPVLAQALAKQDGLTAHRVWVPERSQLWAAAVGRIRELPGCVLLIPSADSCVRAHLQQCLGGQFQWYFPEQDLPTQLPAQLVWTALAWVDPARWGMATTFDTAQLLECGFGLTPGQALRWSRQLHQPLISLTDAPPACHQLSQWQAQMSGQPLEQQWAAVFDLLTVATKDRARLNCLRGWGEQLLALGGADSLPWLRTVGVLPRWELPVDPDRVLVSNPRHFVNAGLISDHQVWLDVTSDQWQVQAGGESVLVDHLQTCLLRNRGSLTLVGTPHDSEGQRQQGPLTLLLSAAERE